MFSFEIQCIVSSSWVLIDLPFTFDGGGGGGGGGVCFCQELEIFVSR